jgi:autotransporter-associated beta strand protein
MKPKPYRTRKSTGLTPFLLAGFLLAAANSASAQTSFFWDADGDTTSDTGGSGTWDAGSSLWRNGSGIGPLEPWPNTDPNADTAEFEGTAGTVTLNSESVNLNRIVFGTTGYEIAGPVSGTATLNLSGSAPRITTGAGISATISADISGTTGLNKFGAGSLTLSGNNSYTGATTITSGSNNGGITNVSGDQSAADGGWAINGDSTVNFLSDSTIVVASGRNITLNNSTSSATFALNAYGTVTSSGTVNVRGRRTLNLESGAEWAQSGSLVIQPLNTAYGATVNVKTGSSFTYSGTANITLAKSTSSGSGSATLTLSGGTFTTSRGFSNNNAGTGSGNTTLNFSNGGTLELSADIPSLIVQGTTAFRVLTNNAAGGVIDTNGFSTSIAVGISGAGSLTKAGAGTLTLSGINSYAGNTTVTDGTLVLAADNTSNDASTVTVSGTGVLQLDYEGTDTVDKLFIGAAQQAAGEYGKEGSPSPIIGIPQITGDGTLTVISGPVGTPFEIFMAAYSDLTEDDALPGADPDGDGLSNLAEFIMGGTAPNSGSTANRPVEAVIDDHLTISMLVPSGATFAGSPSPSATVQGVQVAVGGSLDLATFARPVEATVLNPGLPIAPTGYEWHTFRLSEPISSRTSGFLRASFSTP